MQTLKDIEAISKDLLTIMDIRDYLDCDANAFRLQAHKDPSKIGFPVIVIGSRVKIPKIPFIKFMRGEHES